MRSARFTPLLVTTCFKMAEGVMFPADSSGRRSTLNTGAKVLAAAAKTVDASLGDRIIADAAAQKLRKSYGAHAVALAAACHKGESAVAAAEAGLEAVYSTFEFVRDGKVLTLDQAMATPDPARKLSTGRISGTFPLLGELAVPYQGEALAGLNLKAQLDAWAEYGCMEPGAADALSRVASTPSWLDLRGKCFVVLGGSSALSPLSFLLRCGATVVAVGRRKASPRLWAQLIETARSSAGTLVFPCGGSEVPLLEGMSDSQLAALAGADLLTEAPEIGAWLVDVVASLRLPTTVGMYTYLDSDAHVRVSIACDMVTRPLIRSAAASGIPLSLAYLQTPSVAYLVNEDVHAAASRRHSSSWLRTLGYPSNAGAPAGNGFVHDGILPVQGPNYLLAKSIQQWRALVAREREGLTVSANVAPPARTASVLEGNPNAASINKAMGGMGHTRPMLVFDAGACMLSHDTRHDRRPQRPCIPTSAHHLKSLPPGGPVLCRPCPRTSTWLLLPTSPPFCRLLVCVSLRRHGRSLHGGSPSPRPSQHSFSCAPDDVPQPPIGDIHPPGLSWRLFPPWGQAGVPRRPVVSPWLSPHFGPTPDGALAALSSSLGAKAPYIVVCGLARHGLRFSLHRPRLGPVLSS